VRGAATQSSSLPHGWSDLLGGCQYGLGRSQEECPEGRGTPAELFLLSVYHVPLTPEGEALDIEDDEAPEGHIQLDGAAGENGDPEAGGDSLLDGAIVAEFQAALDIHALLAEELFGRQAGAGSGLPLDKDLAHQPLDRDPPRPGQGMGRSRNDHKLFGQKGLGYMGDLLRRPPHHDEVHLVVQKPVMDGRTVGDLDADRDARMPLLKGAEDRRQHVGSSGACGGKGDPSSLETVKLFHDHLGLFEELVDSLGVKEKCLTRLGQHDGPAHSFEEGCANGLFQLTDLDGDRRLAQIEFLGSPGIAPVASYGEKNSQLVQGHK